MTEVEEKKIRQHHAVSELVSDPKNGQLTEKHSHGKGGGGGGAAAAGGEDGENTLDFSFNKEASIRVGQVPMGKQGSSSLQSHNNSQQ